MTSSFKITKADTMLPVPNSTASYWRSEPHWLDEHRSTADLPAEADIIIIGTGIAGASTAYNLVNSFRNNEGAPQPLILLLEARQVCSGATGRNGGHIKKLPSTIGGLIQAHGRADAEDIVKFVRANIYSVKRVIEKEKIDAEAEMRRSFDVPLTEDDARAVTKEFEELLEDRFPLMQDVGYVGEKFAERITSIHDAKAGLSTPALSLWPYKFVTQLLERVLSTGNVNLQTNTPVTSIETGKDGGYTVKTSRGEVKTPTIVFATNAYTAGLLPQYRSVITPIKGTASHIKVPSDTTHPPPHLSNTYNIRYTANRIDYLNPRPDGGIVVGGGKWTYEEQKELWYNIYDDSTLIEPARCYFDDLMQRHFRGWESSGATTERVWTGIMGVTIENLPHIGKVPGTSGQYVLAGYNGGGMALAFLAALGVARMITEGIPFEETGVPKCMKTTLERLNVGDTLYV